MTEANGNSKQCNCAHFIFTRIRSSIWCRLASPLTIWPFRQNHFFFCEFVLTAMGRWYLEHCVLAVQVAVLLETISCESARARASFYIIVISIYAILRDVVHVTFTIQMRANDFIVAISEDQRQHFINVKSIYTCANVFNHFRCPASRI